MKKSILLSSITAALCISSLEANSQNIKDITVWETQVISSSINLKQDSIENKQASHLSDLLKNIPGVDIGGTHSINNRLNIRSLQDENLDITLDGAKVQNANMFHHIGNLLINPDILKKASIQVGTNSVVNGSLGGSVSFETKDGIDMLEKGKNVGARIQANYSSNNSQGGSLTAYAKSDKSLDFLIYHNYLKKQNWKDGRGVKTFGTEGKVNNTLLKAGYKINDNQKITLSYDKLVDKGDYSPRPDFGRDSNLKATGLYTFDTKYTRETITLKHKLDLADTLLLNTTLYTNENELERYEKLDGIRPVRPPFGGINAKEGLLNGKVKTSGINIKAQNTFDLDSSINVLTYGINYDVQTSKVTWDSKKYGNDETSKSTAIYLQNMTSFENGLSLTPGIRLNKYDFDGSYGKIKDNKLTYSLSSEYELNENLTLLASATTLYKGVEMVDVLATNRITAAQNTNLKADTGINKEIGLKYIADNILNADQLGFSFTYFNTNIKDYIKSSYNRATRVTNVTNEGELKLKGFEASFVYNKNDFTSLVTYSHTKSKLEKTSDPLSTQAGDMLSINLGYKILSNLGLSWQSLYAFEQKDIPAGAYDKKEAYNTHNIALNWKRKSLTLIAGIDNVFDKTYVSHISENRTIRGTSTADYELGRNVKFTIAYKF